MRPLLRVVLVPSATDEGGDGVDGGVCEEDVGELLLPLRHGGEGDGRRGLGDALEDAGVLRGEEAFGDGDVEDDGEDEGGEGDEEGDGLEAEDEAQGAAVEGDDVFKDALGG